jgi:hypothetical protein
MKNEKIKDPQYYNDSLATVWATTPSTAILQAGRLSLDNTGKAVIIDYDEEGNPKSLSIESSGVTKP